MPIKYQKIWNTSEQSKYKHKMKCTLWLSRPFSFCEKQSSAQVYTPKCLNTHYR